MLLVAKPVGTFMQQRACRGVLSRVSDSAASAAAFRRSCRAAAALSTSMAQALAKRYA